MDGLKDSY